MDDNGFVWRRVQCRVCNHFLKYRPSVIGGGRTRFDVFLCDQEAVSIAPFTHLAQLVRNRKVLLGLARSGNASIECDRHYLVTPSRCRLAGKALAANSTYAS